MKFQSIIWLSTSEKSKISKKVIKDLDLEGVYERLLSNDDILFSLCSDIETILFRQEILDDLMNNDNLIDDLVSSLETFYELKPLYYDKHYEASQLYRIIDILIIMEKAIVALEEIRQILDYYPIKSKGLSSFRESISSISSSTEFKNMKKDLKEIKYIFSNIKSAVLSVNMNIGLRPIFAQVTSIDNHRYKYPKAFRKVADVLNKNPEFLGQRLSNYIPVFKVGRLNYDLLEEIEFALDEHKEMLAQFVETYDKIDISPFIRLRDEVEFYKASTQLFKRIVSKGLPLVKPVINEKEGYYKGRFNGIYNINLALVHDKLNINEEMILNDFVVNETKRFHILTGANRGGKTTYTQGIGQVQLMAQLGLFVAGQEVSVSMVDQILTHFPVVEKDTYETGKFGKECELFVEEFKKGTKDSLFLLNESFSGTSHLESLNIATQGCLALIEKGIPFVFNTHLHELYHEVANSSSKGKEQIVSLVTEMNDDISSYKLIERLPLGKSYARKIANKYGVTYEQLVGGDMDETRN